MTMIDAYAGLKGKSAALLGGAYGVGRAVTLALARAGVRIMCCDNDMEAVRAIVPEVEAVGGTIISLEADVLDPRALDAFYDRVEEEFGKLDIVVNVAGGGMRRAPFMETNRAAHAREIRLNYGYVIDSVQRAVPLLRRSGGGSIINFTTIEAQRGAASYAVYAGAKAANANFSRAVAVELAAEGIRVNMIAPDTTEARASYASIGPELQAKMGGLSADLWTKALNLYIPQQRNPTTEDLGNAVLFLVSDLARAIIGQTLHVDGGTSASLGFINWPEGDGWGPAPLVITTQRLFGQR